MYRITLTVTRINFRFFKDKKISGRENISIYESMRGHEPRDSTISGEGHLTMRIGGGNFIFLSSIFTIFLLLLLFKTAILQVREHDRYAEASQMNSFTKQIRFANRGDIFDRNNNRLAWNTPGKERWDERETIGEGFGHLLGYVTYPKKDNSGVYFRSDTIGRSGVERTYDSPIRGINGAIIIEKNSTGDVIAERFLERTADGADMHLTIDRDLQTDLYTSVRDTVTERGFEAGVGAIVDVRTGEIHALVSYPDYDTKAFALGDEKIINTHLADPRNPLFNRAVSGLYTPGSTVKPFFGIAALEEEIITPRSSFESTGKIIIPNPFDPSNPSVFLDWKSHGYVNVSEAIAASSNVFFYIIGGGYRGTEGLGIKRLVKYAELFRLTEPTDLGISEEPAGVIPSPDWKREKFDEGWFLGDTYHTVIGQYGFLLTPLQLLRAVSSIASGGIMHKFRLIKHVGGTEGRGGSYHIPLSHSSVDIVKEAMRLVVTNGTATTLKKYPVAVKTGTAQISNKNIHSLLVGFFPFYDPKFAFVIVAENGPQTESGKGTAIIIADRFFEKYYHKKVDA